MEQVKSKTILEKIASKKEAMALEKEEKERRYKEFTKIFADYVKKHIKDGNK